MQAVRLAQSDSHQLPTIADKTRAEYLGQLKAILEFAFRNGFISTDISIHIEIPNTKHSKAIERLPFSTEDLQKIFPGAEYRVDLGIHKSGVDLDAKFWFPLLAAFSGARLEELGQLNTDNIQTCPDTGIIYAMIDNEGITADGHKKHTKNLNSVRPIPIHSRLIEIGFLDYLEQRKTDTANGMLFKLPRDKQGRLAKSVSNWFSRMEKRKSGSPILGYIERRGVDSKGANAAGERWSKSFHSFRHTAIDNLRGKKLANGEYIREADVGLVMGHDKNKLETAAYGLDRSQLELRKAVIEAIDYPEVAFEDISWG
ncbi:MAG: site-specific integrase [Thermodesulfobacteriota bacterium]